MPTYTQDQIKQIITNEAVRLGVDPKLAIADAMQESGLNPNSVGDNGTSFGLFQLHKGGELGNLSKTQAFDPTTNTDVALSVFAKTMKSHPGIDPGHLAALSERPANPEGYARSVNAIYAKLGKGPAPTTGATPSAPAGGTPSDPSLAQRAIDAVTGGAATDAVDTAHAVTGAFTILTDPKTWIRIGFILGGFIVVMIGLRAMVSGGGLSLPAPSAATTPANNPVPVNPSSGGSTPRPHHVRSAIRRTATHTAEAATA